MTSQRQIAANRRNARKSTGPRTEGGRAVSRLNALRHGLTAQQVVIFGEDEDAFKNLLGQLENELRPEGVLEHQLVERIAIALWRLRRMGRVEAGIFTFERYELEYERALHKARKYKDDVSAMFQPIGMVDSRKYDAAKAKADEIRAREDEELPTLGLAFVRDAGNTNAFSKLSRYEAGIERTLIRAMHELERVQAARKGEPVATPMAVDVTVDAG